jgi:hypothetical protein
MRQVWRVFSLVTRLMIEATPERTRFSMLTADRPSESVIDDYETRSINRDNPNDPNIVSLQGQLNEMFHHVHPP